MTADLVRRPAWQISKAIAARDVSSVEVVGAYLDRIDEEEPVHHALSSRRAPEKVLADAAERDAELARGEYRGWMHGLPHAVKDLADVAGLPTTLGLWPVEQAPVATNDALFVARLRSAGAVFVGKTNTSELGLGSHTYNQIGPPTRNALDPGKSAGGSSGGAAVAVARCMLPVADGSDFMGSLRNPPGWNGVMGLRPTFGRVPSFDDDPFSVGGGVDGPIARNARDLALLLATMAGPDPRVRLSLPDDPASLVSQLERAPSRLRVGWLGDLDGYLATEPGVLELCSRALAARATAGWSVETVSLPRAAGFDSIDALWSAWVTFRSSQSAPWIRSVRSSPDRPVHIKPEAQWEIETYERLTLDDLESASRVRAGVSRSFSRLFEEYDVLALPTAQVFAFDVGTHWPDRIGHRAMDTYHRWMEVTAPATMAGLPVVAVPAGVTSDGAAMGVQLIGRPRSEGLLLQLARIWEQAGG
jgi:amidase